MPTKRTCGLVLAALGAATLLQGYTRLRNESGKFVFRPNPSNIQFLLNNRTLAGLLNTDGNPIITADSAPMAAIGSALESWSEIAESTVSFLPAQLTGNAPNGQNGQNEITVEDTPHNRQIVGDAIAVTMTFSSPSGAISEADIFLNPANLDVGDVPAPFSTTGAPGTFDLETTVLHELGHALGMEHSNVFGASLWPFGRTGETRGRRLTADDIAFAVDFYPVNGAQAHLGRIRGAAAIQGGGPVKSGMAVAVNPATGMTISAQTSLLDGSYSLLAPPGEYIVYLESLSGQVKPSNVALGEQEVTAPFPTTRFSGGPTVTAGGEAVADFTVTLGPPALEIGLVGVSAGGGPIAVHALGAHELPLGSSDVFLWGTGLQAVTEADLAVLAPTLQIVPGSMGFDAQFSADSFTGALYFRVFSSPTTSPPPLLEGRRLATILIESGGLTAAATGALVLQPPATGPFPAHLGVFVNGAWFLDLNGDSAFDSQTEILGWGSPGDKPVAGDWNGDGLQDLGVFSGGVWFIDIDGDRGFAPATEIHGWGQAGWTPAPGDWNGDGRTDLGVVSPDSTWFRDLNGDFVFDPATEIHGWGSTGDEPVVADWNGDGLDEMAVFSGGLWFIDFNGDGAFDPATEVKGWGVSGWTPIAGDWNGDGKAELGAVSPDSTWFRDLNGDFAFDPATEVLTWGSAGDTPLVADWDGDGADEIGVFSDGTWFLDSNSDGAFDPATEIKGWGAAGWAPLPGIWR